MKNKITLLTLFCITLFSFAQPGMPPVGHLTIFSEDGDKFFLILNGERQNDVAQTNLRVEDLNQPYYNAKIIFENKSLLDISKNFLPITDADKEFQDVTYKIKKDKNNKTKMKMNFFSMIPVQVGFIPPSNVHVIHYGQPVFVETNPSHSTTTTTTSSTVGGVGVGVNVGGVSIGVNINEPVGTVTQTTTTTHSSSGNTTYSEDPRPRGCTNRNAMNANNFSSALATIKKQGFDDTKLKIAKQIADANCLNTNQITQICQTFGFEDNKLDFAKFAYDYCVEPKNYFKLNSIFSFSSNVDDLTDYIQSRN